MKHLKFRYKYSKIILLLSIFVNIIVIQKNFEFLNCEAAEPLKYGNNNNSDSKRSASVIAPSEKNQIKSIKLPSKHRQRRYLAFPDGSSFTCAICATVGIVGNIDPSYMSYGLNWGLAYDLPNATFILDNLYSIKNLFRKKPTTEPHYNDSHVYSDHHNYHNYDHYNDHNEYRFEKARRAIVKRDSRKKFYKEVEFIIGHVMGYNGRDCVLRTLCESAQYFNRKKKGSMLEEILKTIFSFPKYRLFSFESPDIKEYDEAYRYGHKIDDCSTMYNGCEFSLIDLAFGKYSEPPPNFMNEDDSDNMNPFPNQD